MNRGQSGSHAKKQKSGICGLPVGIPADGPGATQPDVGEVVTGFLYHDHNPCE